MYKRRIQTTRLRRMGANENHSELEAVRLIAFVLAHVPLALAMQYGTSLVTVIHAGLVAIAGLKWAVDGRLDRVAYVGAYITGAEVLWRMTNDRLFWETGKYTMVLIFAIGIIKSKGLRIPVIPSGYFLLLLPSALLTIAAFDAAEAQNQLSFNLSGPLALMVSATFFWDLRLTPLQRKRLMMTMVGPIVGIATIAVAGILTNPNIVFTTESNIETSGGYGPNQVASVLGLGALLFWLCLQEPGWTVWLRGVLFAGLVWLAAQSALTFSRGGIYGAVGGALLASVYLVRDNRLRLRLIGIPVLVFLVGQQILWPRLDEFTDGALTARFQETEMTHRGDISESDYELWVKNPLMGVGPGVSRFERLDQRATHTEFTRLVAEHGTLGALALLLLVVGSARNLLRPGPSRQKGLVAAMLGWSTLYMLNSAMRLVAPSFTFGLAFSSWSPEEFEAPAPQRESKPSTRAGTMPRRAAVL
jgi:hypothetical protein